MKKRQRKKNAKKIFEQVILGVIYRHMKIAEWASMYQFQKKVEHSQKCAIIPPTQKQHGEFKIAGIGNNQIEKAQMQKFCNPSLGVPWE